jgi:hypothetical protein
MLNQTVHLSGAKIDFDVVQLRFNDKGQFLGVMGFYSLVVVDMCTQTALSINAAPNPTLCLGQSRSSIYDHLQNPKNERPAVFSITCDSYSVGSFEETHLVEFRWHPLSSSGADLVVLTDRGYLQIFDLYESTSTPIHSHYCLDEYATKAYRNPYCPEKDSFSVASFCFGPVVRHSKLSETLQVPWTTAWLPMTVFITMISGDIFALCPIVPQNWYAFLLSFCKRRSPISISDAIPLPNCEPCSILPSKFDLHNLNATIDRYEPETEEQHTLSNFLSQFKSCIQVPKDSLHFTLKVDQTLSACPQLIQRSGAPTVALHDPNCSSLSLSVQYSILETENIEGTLQQTVLPFLVQTFSNGFVDILSMEAVFPLWGRVLENQHGNYCCSSSPQPPLDAFAVESFDLETEGYLRVIDDPNVPNCSVVIHSKGAELITINIGGLSQVQPLVSSLLIVDGMSQSPILGGELVIDPILDKSLILMTPLGAVSVDLASFEYVGMSWTSNRSGSQSTSDASSVLHYSPNSLILPNLTSPALTLNLKENSHGISESQLECVRKYHNHILKVVTSTLDLSFDIEKLLSKQLALLQTAPTVTNSLGFSARVPASKLKDCQSQNRNLSHRIDRILQMWHNASSYTTLTPAERNWQTEVAIAMDTVRVLLAKGNRLRERKSEMLDRNSSKLEVEKLSEAAQDRIERLLTAQYVELQIWVMWFLLTDFALHVDTAKSIRWENN